MGCFNPIVGDIVILKFPSPCGVWVVSLQNSLSPQGASFRPLAGCGLFPRRLHGCDAEICFRPLAGCGLFPSRVLCSRWVIVSVPLRGVGCFLCMSRSATCGTVSVPLRGVGCFGMKCPTMKNASRSFRPLAGCGLFLNEKETKNNDLEFPSPCGVWVVSRVCLRLRVVRRVSVPLRGVGCFGKAAHSFWCNRKKNCQLCYFIVSYWQMFINSKLRNCKVPCEAHKTAT